MKYAAVLLWVMVVSAVFADDAEKDAQAIRAVMVHTWDKPDARLQVEPVVVAGDHALASWVQGERGGRAILARREGQWQVLVCTGDGALDALSLQQTGMPLVVAEKLAAALSAAEAGLPAEQRAKFSLFGSAVHMPAAGNTEHSSGNHH